MKIISYNVNGFRAAFTKDFLGWLKVANPDVICIQESKAGNDQIDIESLQQNGYFSYWHSAQKKGYSGVGIASKIAPKHIEIGCGIESYDNEGRIMRADFENFSVLSVYVPSASNIERLDFKMEFCEDFLKDVEFDTLICTGKSTQMVNDVMEGQPNKKYLNFEGKDIKEVERALYKESQNALIFCVGNIHGPGKEIAQYIEGIK